MAEKGGGLIENLNGIAAAASLKFNVDFLKLSEDLTTVEVPSLETRRLFFLATEAGRELYGARTNSDSSDSTSNQIEEVKKIVFRILGTVTPPDSTQIPSSSSLEAYLLQKEEESSSATGGSKS